MKENAWQMLGLSNTIEEQEDLQNKSLLVFPTNLYAIRRSRGIVRSALRFRFDVFLCGYGGTSVMISYEDNN